jgi:hypothetical protein
MRKILSVTFLFVVVFNMAFAQSPKELKKFMELKIHGEGGANGASIAWHPGQKKYYVAMAGNASFPMNVFNEKGTRLSDDAQNTLFDVRGLWYNTSKKTLQANGYNTFGWAEYTLNAKGMPEDLNTFVRDMHQPNSQSVAAYNTKNNKVYFLNEEGSLEVYSCIDGTYEDLQELRLSVAKKDDDGSVHNDDVLENYNSTTVIYTGVPNAEFGVLNTIGKQIELYSQKDGYLGQTLRLPDDAPFQKLLNFTYANGVYWLFDKEERKWVGYK